MDNKTFSSIHYSNYLQLEKITNAQKLRSEELDQPAHDEMLFIIIHQVYELWFKQIIHELKSIMDLLRPEIVDEKDIGKCVHRFSRITEIQNVMIAQIKVIETLTPLDFLDFRNLLVPASGFQSYQFRVCEIAMGLKMEMRTTYNQKIYSNEFTEEQKKELHDLENGNSLFDIVEKWLERMPFISSDDFSFKQEYLHSVDNMAQSQKDAMKNSKYVTPEQTELRTKMIDQNKQYIYDSLNENLHNKQVKEGNTRISYKANVAALMINLYREQPILRGPYNLINKIVEMDEQFSMFRYRHSQMVMRILGKKMGTGGSSGHEYLMKTVLNHQIFRDLHNISTLLIPRSELPELPKNVLDKLGFKYES
ncbi:tryptophan 2,3-dioxygenase family protein [Candidatus Kapabacteria bacterium]|nr:tryptophan 2,3-dioxygenase family protein [Candidatus Kapabacteria bacterium]